MDIGAIQSSIGLWVCSIIMVGIIVVQAILFMNVSRKEAKKLGISEDRQKEAIRSAAITCLGPALALSIMLITLMANLGAPTAWMRMNDVGSGRTELAIASMVADLVEAQPNTPEWALQNFSFAVWAQGIDVAGWIIGGMVAVILGGKLTKTLNEKFDTVWVKILMSGCLVSLFTYLLINQVYGKPAGNYVSAAIGGVVMLIMNTVFSKNKRMQELSLGIAIFVGAALTQIIMG